MLLTLSTTYKPATDLGFLLRKHPARVHCKNLNFGCAHVFYPEATEDRCTAALLLEVDPVGLVRNRRGPAGEGRLLEQYVNDRPYVASSFLSVAISEVFDSAMAGRSKERPDLVSQLMPLTAEISVLPCRGGESILRRLFEPLGYKVATEGRLLDDRFSDWGAGPYFNVTLEATTTVQQLLTHLYVLIPVLDNDKHYWIGDDEVEKLLRHGKDWLTAHPEKKMIVSRYLKHQRNLVEDALDQLLREESPLPDHEQAQADTHEQDLEESISLNEQRHGAVLAALKNSGAKRIMDLGCAEGRLLQLLLKEKQFDFILGMDVSYRALEIARRRLHWDRLSERQRQRVELIHGSLMYRDKRLSGFDAASIVEVIEHLDAPRLHALERAVFESARPSTVVLTTPNVEYNAKWPNLGAGKLRHRDHRFEWTRQEFQNWSDGICNRFGYDASILPVGPVDTTAGAPTQMGIFTLK